MAFTTRKSLLAKVRAGDEISWREFYDNYKPLILLCGNDCNLSSNEKSELVQLVMAEVFQKDIIGKYDLNHVPDNVKFTYNPVQGSFRHYLRHIILNQVLKIIRQKKLSKIWRNNEMAHYTKKDLELYRHGQMSVLYGFRNEI